jgi:glycosyltransferase involved in cell wall biosynthesis
MKLLHLMGSAIDGGAETYFLALAAAFQRAGIDQAVALRPHAAREAALRAMDIPFTVLPFARFDFTTKGRVARYATDQGATVLLAWMSRAAQHMPAGPWRRIGRHGGYYNLRFYKGCDLLVGNTEDITRSIVARGWPAGRVRTIRNFAATDALPALPRTSFDTPPGVKLALSMGRLHPDKAHDVTLRALAQIPGLHLWLAGSGPEEGALKQLARQLGVADRVRFLGWREDAGALYRAADLCLFPSRVEPLGNVIIQCWAYGLPVVTAASIGPAALVRNEVDGLIVAVEDAEAVAAAARRILDEPGLADRLRAEGLARAEAEYGEAAVVAQWREVLAA